MAVSPTNHKVSIWSCSLFQRRREKENRDYWLSVLSKRFGYEGIIQFRKIRLRERQV